MVTRRTILAVLLAAATLGFGCGGKAVTTALGGVDVVVRSTSDGQPLGDLTLRREDGSKTWRWGLRAKGYQQRRLVLEPGRYTLDFEADVGARVADPAEAVPVREVHAAPGELPRWVVVTPARVTTVNLAIEVEVKTLSVAAGPGPALQR